MTLFLHERKNSHICATFTFISFLYLPVVSFYIYMIMIYVYHQFFSSHFLFIWIHSFICFFFFKGPGEWNCILAYSRGKLFLDPLVSGIGGLRIKLTKYKVSKEKSILTYLPESWNKWLEFSLYTYIILMGRGRRKRKGHLWKNKKLLGKTSRSLGE